MIRGSRETSKEISVEFDSCHVFSNYRVFPFNVASRDQSSKIDEPTNNMVRIPEIDGEV